MKKIVLILTAAFMFLSVVIVYAEGVLTLPFYNSLTKGYGYSGYSGHKGTDWYCNIGTVIVAAEAGVVTTHDGGYQNADPDEDGNPSDGGGYGNWISINHGTVNGKTVETHYAHLTTGFLVQNEEVVERGQPIAYSGHNGYSTTPHIHLTVLVDGVKVDPYNESSLSVDQYEEEKDNYLWTFNPPMHAFYYINLSEIATVGEMEGSTQPPSGYTTAEFGQLFIDAMNEVNPNAVAFNNGGGAGVHLWGNLFIQDLKSEPSGDWYVAVYNHHLNDVVVLENDWRFAWLSYSGYEMGPPVGLKTHNSTSQFEYAFGNGMDYQDEAVLSSGDLIEAYVFGNPDGERHTLVRKNDGSIYRVDVGLFNFTGGTPGDEWFIWKDLNENGSFFLSPPMIDGTEFFSVFMVGTDGTAARFYQPKTYYFANVVSNQIPQGKSSFHTVVSGNNQTMSLTPNALQPPININLTVVSENSIEIDAQDPNNPVPSTVYEVDIDAGSRVETISDFPYTLSGLTENVAYAIRLRSLNQGVYSIYSNTFSVVIEENSSGNNQSQIGMYEFTSVPSNASITIYTESLNGQIAFSGSTPVSGIPLNVGSYVAIVSSETEDQLVAFDAVAGQDTSVNVFVGSGNGNPVQFFQITTEPKNVTLQVTTTDGYNNTMQTPQLDYMLGAQVATFNFSEPGYAPWDTTLQLVHHDTLAMHVVLTYIDGMPTPLLEVDKDTINLGNVVGQNVVGKFSILNNGTAPLQYWLSSDSEIEFVDSVTTIGIGYSHESVFSFDLGDIPGVYTDSLIVNSNVGQKTVLISYQIPEYQTFIDSFDRILVGGDWLVENENSVSIVSNQLYLTSSGPGNGTVFALEPGNVLNVAVGFTVSQIGTVQGGNMTTGGYLRYKDLQNHILIRSFYDAQRIKVDIFNQGIETRIYDEAGCLEPGKRYQWSVSDSTLIIQDVDDHSNAHIITSPLIKSIDAGKIGFWSNEQHLYLDNIRIDFDTLAQEVFQDPILSPNSGNYYDFSSGIPPDFTVSGPVAVIDEELNVSMNGSGNGTVHFIELGDFENGSLSFDFLAATGSSGNRVIAVEYRSKTDPLDNYMLRYFRPSGVVKLDKHIDDNRLLRQEISHSLVFGNRYGVSLINQAFNFFTINNGDTAVLGSIDGLIDGNSITDGEFVIWVNEDTYRLDNIHVESYDAGLNKAGVGGREVLNSLPSAFMLYAAYPNPFNPETRIRFDLPEDGDVTIKVYDILGREIAVLLDGYQEAGTHTVIWNGKNQSGQSIANGVYLYRMQAGSYVKTRKLTILK